MTEQQVENIIEGILFASGEPVEVAKLAQTLEMPKQEVRAVADHLMHRYEDREGGLCILKLEDSYQMCTNPAYGNYISLALQKKKKPVLSPAALEVLSIVAYKQPVTKAYVEQVRGVESSNVVNNLVEKGYIEEAGKLDAPGRPTLFTTSKEFLRVFGLRSIGELPAIPEIREEEQEP